ncbi:MAG TPA: ABC transporter permease [Aggregatilinea sp.]|jgi:ABC-2 type transport system permease protein|uniref:ABC transporter permease n=1 Tax=Aggregatilinea sp. TaxID=2806333 RepID=UPI002B68E783|nr:ABC transporter permease [Aggregatilinea sp.]HML22679.1 ABC transporter permease [Aggregatilinea sp.]
MRSLAQLFIASVREFTRDITALFWTMAFPLFFIFIFGVIFSGDGEVSFDLGIVNQAGDAGQQLVDTFKSIEAFDVTTGTQEDELAALKDGDRSAVIVIPAEAADTLRLASRESGELPTGGGSESAAPQAALDVYYDPANTNTSQIVLNIVDKVVGGINQGITGVQPVVTLEQRTVTSTSLRNIDYLLPGVIAMSLMQLGLFGTAAPLVSLREKQVLRRMGATPLSRTTLLISQILFRLAIAAVQLVVIMGVGALAFDVHIEARNIPGIIGIAALGSTMFITLGYFLSGLAKTEEAVQGIVQLPNFVFMFLSGIFFPVDMMPSWLRPVVDAIPLSYLADALRKLMIDAGSYYSLTTSVLILSAWLLACGVLAVRFFKWEPQG